MTWVAVVKFWAYQAYQLRIIVYAKTMRTIHGLELFSSANRQWGLSGANGDGYGIITFPLTFSNTNYAVMCLHNGIDPLIIAEYISQRYAGQTTWTACDRNGKKESSWSVRYIAIGY